MDIHVKVDSLSKTFGKFQAVKNVSFEINNGDCIGLVGPNGAGKTTLLKMITGILQQTTGTVAINNEPVEKQRQLIGYLPQIPNFYDWMNAEEVLSFSLDLFHTDKTTKEQRITETLELVGLAKDRKRKVRTFSGGMRQRLGIAQAVIHQPSFLILDEPVSALDPIGRREVLNLIETLKENMTIIFSTHILNDAEDVCNRFCVMKNGTLVDDFYLEEKQNEHSGHTLKIKSTALTETFIEKIKEIPEISNVTSMNETLTVESSSTNQSWERKVLELLLRENIPFEKIEVNQFSLEDYFMKLVGDVHA